MIQAVVFTLGGERYALPIDRVQEVIRHRPPKPVGSPIPYVAGVIELRGRVVPVCDVAARVGARAAADVQQKIVIVDLPGGQAGVLVDAVDQVVTLPDEQLAPVPPEVATELVRAIAQLGDELVMVLDAERLLAGVVEPPPAANAEAPEAEAGPEPEAAAEPEPEPAAKPKPKRKPAARKPAARKAPTAQPSRKRSENATRSTGDADSGSPSNVTS